MEPFKTFIDRKIGYFMLLPAILGILFVQIYPSLESIRMSFFDIQLLNPVKPFCGFHNYQEAFADPVFFKILANTVIWALLSLAIGLILGLFAAIELNKPFRGRGFFRALFLAPWITPPFVIAAVWSNILSENFSPINGLLMKIGLLHHPISFLGNTKMFLGVFSLPMFSLIVVNVWCIFSFMMVMFLAGLQTIPEELYEAATVDGATKRQQFFKITLPMLKPVMETVVLLQGIWQFNNFNLSYLLTHGGPLNLTELLAVRVYNQAFQYFKYGFAASLSVIMFLVILIPAIIYVKRAAVRDELY